MSFLEALDHSCTFSLQIPHRFENVYILWLSHCTQLSSFPVRGARWKSCQKSRMTARNSATQRFGSCRQTHRNRWVDMEERLAFDFCFLKLANWAKQQKSGSIRCPLGRPGFCGSALLHLTLFLFQDNVTLETGSHPDLAVQFLPIRIWIRPLCFPYIYLCFGLLNAESMPQPLYPSTVLFVLDKKTLKSRQVISYVVSTTGLSTLFSLSSFLLVDLIFPVIRRNYKPEVLRGVYNFSLGLSSHLWWNASWAGDWLLGKATQPVICCWLRSQKF